jgi:hypothetical protein
VVNATPRVFTPWKGPVPNVYEAGWAPGPVWTGAENLAPIRILSPDHLARCQSLYNTYRIQNLKFGTKNTGEIRRDKNMKIHFKETGWEVVCSNSEI